MKKYLTIALLILISYRSCLVGADDVPLNISGVYPHLRMWNSEGECGTGALVLWQGDLWAVTYAPHAPSGSSDKLYQVTSSLEQKIFEGSVGGTPANRMIHRESNQLLIGPYLIDENKAIRVIPSEKMFGRLTANARHLFDPANKIYYATMEEGLYEVDVKTLIVNNLIKDGHTQAPKAKVSSDLPGYHGKGLYTSQGRLVYANNGENGPKVKVDPTVTSGALAEWYGEGSWQLVRRNQFTEVTGPGGIYGNKSPDSDPLWAMGWDAKSVILALLEDKKWHYYRLPKGSHSYDGAHGWNTEWPRIREIGEDDFLATMHGTFWKFPPGFSKKNSAGIAPRSNYLKVIGDFCRWEDRIVMGCDDSAKAEFLNTRSFKASHGAPQQSNSNLWFIQPDQLDHLGPVIGRGSVWLREDLEAGAKSDPYLFSGYDYRQLHINHQSDQPIQIDIEVDHKGEGRWEKMKTLKIPAHGTLSHLFDEKDNAAWIRLKTESSIAGISAHFQYRNRDGRSEQNADLFSGIATPSEKASTTGVMRSIAYDRLALVSASTQGEGNALYYEINERMEIVSIDKPGAAASLVSSVRQPENSITEDEASLLLVEDGRSYRLPKNPLYSKPRVGAGEEKRKGESLTDFLPQSLTREGTVKASSTHGDNRADLAIDGNLSDDGSRWISKEGGKDWIEIDLGAEKRIQSLWVVSGWKKETPYIAKNFDVQVWDSGSWVTPDGGEIRGNDSLERELAFSDPVTTSKIRIVSTSSGFLRIYEIAAFDKILNMSRPSARSFGQARICREVATERDLLNVHGTFYELPARNAQGMAKVRPIATHNLAIQDFCSHNGLLLFTGIDDETQSEHIFRSDDGRAAVWAGVIDDLWQLGKPRGKGGPWANSKVKAGDESDPYLMTSYDKKSVEITSSQQATISLEVDIDGTGLWIKYKDFSVQPGDTVSHTFPEGYSAYWVRAVSDVPTTASVIFEYR